jgi:hypothetical protein
MDRFFELFNPYPGNHYLYATTKVDEIYKRLNKLLEGVNGELELVLYGKACKEGEHIQVIESFDRPYRSKPRDKDVVILNEIYSNFENKDLLLSSVYRSLGHAANIVLIERVGVLDRQILQKLEEFEFRAANITEGLIEGCEIITGKKMHMWGNGL